MLQNKLWRVLAGIVIGLALLFTNGTPLSHFAVAQTNLQPAFPEGESEYFYATGYYVQGPFLDFFRTRGGLEIFGYPRTQVFYDAQLGLWVQYFDNVRMEWHPGNPDPYKVQLGLLGELLGHRAPSIPSDAVPYGNPFRRYFPETGHVVSFAFLVYFDQSGGLDIFGYPIAEPLVENGRIVQYFQRARMEWHPERPRDERVVLGALGSAYLQRSPVPTQYTGRQVAPSAPATTSQSRPDTGVSSSTLRVWAFVRQVITGREGNQTVYVYVTDAAREPVTGATATVVVRLPSDPVQYSLPPTDDRGITSVEFSVQSLPPGQKVIIDVTVQYGSETGSAQTSFVPWY